MNEKQTMINRSVHMIFEPSGMPIPTEEEVRFEACEMVQRSGWGLPLIERLRKMADPYWREAVTRCLMNQWLDMLRDKDEQTYYYDSDGDIRYCWMDAEYDFNRIIRKSTAEQVEEESGESREESGESREKAPVVQVAKAQQPIINYYIQNNNGPIITDSNVTIHQQS